jgi:hypothetical protein
MKLDTRLEEARELMKTLGDKRTEIDKIEKDMVMELQESKSENQSAHTEQFLKLGAEAIRMEKLVSGKKRAADEVEEDVDDEEGDDCSQGFVCGDLQSSSMFV